MNKSLRRLAGAVIAVIVLASGTARALDLGAAAGPITLTSVLGSPIVLENYAERPATAIVFLSSRSEATVKAMAELNQLYRKHRLQDVLSSE